MRIGFAPHPFLGDGHVCAVKLGEKVETKSYKLEVQTLFREELRQHPAIQALSGPDAAEFTVKPPPQPKPIAWLGPRWGEHDGPFKLRYAPNEPPSDNMVARIEQALDFAKEQALREVVTYNFLCGASVIDYRDNPVVMKNSYLDKFGELYAVTRKIGESDTDFRKRILGVIYGRR